MPDVRFTGNMPPPGQMFCLLCAASFKNQAMTTGREHLAKLQASGGEFDLRRFQPEGGGRPEIAVAYGVVVVPLPPPNSQQMAVPVPLCWTHLLAIQLVDTALDVTTKLPGGAVDLSARRG